MHPVCPEHLSQNNFGQLSASIMRGKLYAHNARAVSRVLSSEGIPRALKREYWSAREGATLGSSLILNGMWHDLVLSGRKTRGRRVGEILVEMLINSRKNAEIDENQDRCPRFKRNARKNGEMLMIHENTWNALRIEFTSVAKLRFQGKLVIDALKCVKPSKIGLKWTKMWNHGKWLIWIHVLSEYL